MTRNEWIELRRRQGHKIQSCARCNFKVPAYLGIWWHYYITGHGDFLHIIDTGETDARKESST